MSHIERLTEAGRSNHVVLNVTLAVISVSCLAGRFLILAKRRHTRNYFYVQGRLNLLESNTR